MIDWDKYFGPTPGGASGGVVNVPLEEADNTQKIQMITMPFPWITFLTATSFDSQVGAMIVLLCYCFNAAYYEELQVHHLGQNLI